MEEELSPTEGGFKINPARGEKTLSTQPAIGKEGEDRNSKRKNYVREYRKS